MPLRGNLAAPLAGAAALSAAAFIHHRTWQAERRNPPRGRFEEVDGVRLHYLDRGSGVPLVMLHGLGTMAEELALSPLYEAAIARYRVIAVDRPGYGYSSRPRGRWLGPQRQAALVRALLARIGVERPVLFGHSFGALVALAYALAYPAALRGLVLASGYYFPSARLDVPLMAPPAIPFLGALMRHTVSPLLARAMWPAMTRYLFSPAPVPPSFERFPVWMALRPSQLRSAAQEAALVVPAAAALARRYERLEVAPVIAVGARDRYIDPQAQSLRLAAAVPRRELVVSPRAGHMLHHSDPRRALQAIEAAG